MMIKIPANKVFILVVMVVIVVSWRFEDVDASSRELFRSPGITIVTAEEDVKSFEMFELPTDFKPGDLKSAHREFKRPLKGERSTLRRLLAPEDSRKPPSNGEV
ncbi:hypothetical protein MPTK1_3g04770 [Marchantia polymorpha subsp. ruderalis]|uniref:Uncharacterized protein n=2 Tax=Marchantia polymorpha TaxID=3197 RepID=A0A176VFR5_MARPO|nr:hypothetical protein AXG93_3810s1050 [Marchantia polymorpha subsp. ruderalis]PTQ43948.1 hypothetical protein MARPO_0022s0052 [Marchantia polymorpha]BBN04454.1 hypothetical protein Mp_3g04770 [Marchantia polymorpha subsp. ruderalis]|eukprot:PTQ43948.1 hypothetical protein MARPO_0022s0052 [Marchantia polymorpha]